MITNKVYEQIKRFFVYFGAIAYGLTVWFLVVYFSVKYPIVESFSYPVYSFLMNIIIHFAIYVVIGSIVFKIFDFFTKKRKFY